METRIVHTSILRRKLAPQKTAIALALGASFILGWLLSLIPILPAIIFVGAGAIVIFVSLHRKPILLPYLLVVLMVLQLPRVSILNAELAPTDILAIFALLIWASKQLVQDSQNRVYKRRIPLVLLFAISAYVLLTFVSVLVAGPYGKESIRRAIHVALDFALLLFFLTMWEHPNQIRSFAKHIVQLGVLIAIVGILYGLATTPTVTSISVINSLREPYIPLLDIPAIGAVGLDFGPRALYLLPLFLSISVLISTSQKRYLIYALVLLAAILLTFIRGLVIAVIVGVLVILVISSRKKTLGSKRWIIALALAAVFVIAMLNMLLPADVATFYLGLGRTDTITARFGLWSAAWSLFLENPLAGVGVGNFERYFDSYLPNNVPARFTYLSLSAHSDFLDRLAETGLFGAVSFLFLALVIVWLSWRGMSRVSHQDRPIAAGLLATTVAFMSLGFYANGFTAWMGLVSFAALLKFAKLNDIS